MRVGAGSTLADFVRRHPLIAYFGLAYAGTWLVWAFYMLSLDGLALLPFHAPASYLIIIGLGTFTGPHSLLPRSPRDAPASRGSPPALCNGGLALLGICSYFLVCLRLKRWAASPCRACSPRSHPSTGCRSCWRRWFLYPGAARWSLG